MQSSLAPHTLLQHELEWGGGEAWQNPGICMHFATLLKKAALQPLPLPSSGTKATVLPTTLHQLNELAFAAWAIP